MSKPTITFPNIERIRATSETTLSDSLKQTQQFINANVQATPGNRRAAPSSTSHPILPKNPNS